MDARSYEAISEVVSVFECYVTPKPKEDDALLFFDVVSETGSLSPAIILNALSAARDKDIMPQIPQVQLIAAQMGRLTLQDWSEL